MRIYLIWKGTSGSYAITDKLRKIYDIDNNGKEELSVQFVDRFGKPCTIEGVTKIEFLGNEYGDEDRVIKNYHTRESIKSLDNDYKELYKAKETVRKAADKYDTIDNLSKAYDLLLDILDELNEELNKLEEELI